MAFDDGMFPERSPEEKAARKSFSTRIGHVKRRVMRDERLKGVMLEFALSLIGDDAVANKLKHGTTLTDYEKHLLVDVWLLHARLGGP
jgi:hypothetical protein